MLIRSTQLEVVMGVIDTKPLNMLKYAKMLVREVLSDKI